MVFGFGFLSDEQNNEMDAVDEQNNKLDLVKMTGIIGWMYWMNRLMNEIVISLI